MLDEILQRISPLQFYTRYLRLRQAGKNYKALCPFHHDRNPSLHIQPATGLWYCFGCHKGGNLVQFVMAMERLSFSEAMVFLAKEAGIEWKPGPRSSQFARLYEANEFATEFYHKILTMTERGRRFQEEYLTPRGIDINVIKEFRLGLALEEPDRLTRTALDKGFTTEDLHNAALSVEKQGKWVDRFHYRLMFPITDVVGRVTGFAGRAIRTGDEPKYLNTPQTSIFDKGKTLYGLSHGRSFISRDDFALLVEGYPDVLILHKFGFKQAVASMGTSLTQDQVRLLRQFTENVFIAFDPDSSGQDATLRSIQLFLSHDIHPRIVELPEGTDPDEFLLKNGTQSFQQLLNSSTPFLDFVAKRMLSRYPPENAQSKRKFLQEFFPFLHSLSDPIQRDEYLQKLPTWLKISPKTLQALWQTYHKKPAEPLPSEVWEVQIKHRQELQLLYNLIEDVDLLPEVQKTLQPEDFSLSSHQNIYQALCLGKKTTLELMEFFSEQEEESRLLSLITTDPALRLLTAQEVTALAHYIKRNSLSRSIQQVKEQWEQAQKSGNAQLLQELQNRYQDLIRLRNRLLSPI
ncbi:MAG: DNA primase [bacterium JZ-2024 1]